jgi:hypothetical protein
VEVVVEGVNVYVIKDQIQMIIVDIALDLILAGVPEASFERRIIVFVMILVF